MPRLDSPLRVDRFSGVLVKLGMAWIYGLALSQLILRLNRLPQDPFSQGLAMLALLLLLALLTWQRYSLLVLSGLLVIATLVAWRYQENGSMPPSNWPDAGKSG